MLIIRAEQMKVFEQAALRRFEDEMVLHLVRFAPRHCELIGEAVVREVITGDVWTENAPTNRPLYRSVTPNQIAATPNLSASDLYLGSSIVGGGLDVVTNNDVQPTGRYLKCFVNITDVESCYCRPC